MTWQPRTLLITDSNLGLAAFDIVSPLCSDLTWLTWDMSAEAPRAEALRRITADRWDLAISFYSDLVLSAEALTAIALPLNIHPALPHIRGVGHDVVPIAQRHEAIGVTLHRMETRIDFGEIYATIRTELPSPATYDAVRAANQRNSLAMLIRLGEMLETAGTVAKLEANLRSAGHDGSSQWGSHYYSRAAVAAIRQQLEAAAS